MCYNTFIKAVLKEFLCMQPYSECPQVLRDFLSYHESIKGQSRRTVSVQTYRRGISSGSADVSSVSDADAQGASVSDAA